MPNALEKFGRKVVNPNIFTGLRVEVISWAHARLQEHWKKGCRIFTWVFAALFPNKLMPLFSRVLISVEEKLMSQK